VLKPFVLFWSLLVLLYPSLGLDRATPMNSFNHKEEELRRREKELEERERAIRLQELEAEINQVPTAEMNQSQKSGGADPPLYETRKHQEPEGKLQRWQRKLVKIGTFLGIMVVVGATIWIAKWLAMAVMAGLIGWLGYKLFLEEDRSERK